jgi:hypothetical protein
MRSGHFVEAERLFRDTLAIWSIAFGPDHVQTANAYLSLGNLLVQVQRPQEAVLHAHSALEIFSRRLAKSHPWIFSAVRVTANALAALDRIDEANALCADYGVEANYARSK